MGEASPAMPAMPAMRELHKSTKSRVGVSDTSADDPPPHYWSAVVHERFWVAHNAAQAATLAAQGYVAYQPDEIWHLQELKASDPQTFPEKLRAIHRAKTLFGATITPAAPPTTGSPASRAARPRPMKPRDPRLGPIWPRCATCGDLRYWHDHAAATWHCWTCTPPPTGQGMAGPGSREGCA
jgi:hypothetical protein